MNRQIMWKSNRCKRKAIKLKQRILLANNAIDAGVSPSVAAGWFTLSMNRWSTSFEMFIYV